MATNIYNGYDCCIASVLGVPFGIIIPGESHMHMQKF